MFKKIFITSVLTALMSSLICSIQVSASDTIVASFSDVPQYDSNYQAIDSLRADGIIAGYGDGTFGLGKDINRAEFLKIVMEANDYTGEGENCYKDVKDQWYAKYICQATELNFVSGYSDGYFRPEQEINFAEASKIIVKVFGQEPGDPVKGEQWFAPYVKVLESDSSIPYYIDNFDDKLTREAMSEMAYRIMNGTTYKVSNTYENILAGVAVQERGGELQDFESCGELKDYFEDNAYQYYVYPDDVMLDETTAGESEENIPLIAPSESKSAADSATNSGEAASDYSQTNVQVEGVDEADIVKNDGKYIYSLKGNTVRIIEAYPPDGMVELGKVSFGDENFYPSDMYVDGDRLVVIGSSYGVITYTDFSDESYYYGNYEGTTSVFIFDISDKADVNLVRDIGFEGYYSTSRKVGGTMYLVMNQYNYYLPYEGDIWKEGDLVPQYSDNGEVDNLVTCGDVRYMPGITENTNYMILAAIPVDDEDGAIGKEVVIGSTGNVYSSTDNLYIAEPKYNYNYWYEDSGSSEETYVHKFALDAADIEYKGVSSVPGTTLNQFSMDENDGYFRIATTTGSWGDELKNNLYVLDENLNLVGSLEGLAPGEKIYSVRFMGDRAYLVTFETIDPLFVIDLSAPESPKVLGELHIPGVSNYLHPYDEDHLIGFGLDTPDEETVDELGWAWYQGIKVSMFDVSDVNNPKELFKTVIGDRGTYSDLQYNHKAFLFDKAKGIMAFPVLVAEIPQQVKDDLDLEDWIYGEYTFQGAYVYDVNLEDGFTLKGRISHYDEDSWGDNFYYYYNNDWVKSIQRILYIGDYFYTVSQEMVKANKMDDLEEAGSIELKD